MAKRGDLFDATQIACVYHPGNILEEKLQEMGMSVKEFAIRTSKPEKTIIAVIKGKSSITPDMAIAFELVTRIPSKMWLRHQKSYDDFMAREKREKSMKEEVEWTNKFPYDEIQALDWFSEINRVLDMTKNDLDTLCKFFAVSSSKGWQDFYMNRKLQIAFRITLAEACDPYALSAWLRRGEIQAEKIKLDTKYSAKLLRGILKAILNLRTSKEEERNSELERLLGSVGVKLIFTETLSTAPVKGCTRYIYGVPCIQMAKIFESESDFWYTLMHEIGHILLHGKKNIFMENVNYGDKDPKKEAEADEFAMLWLSKSHQPISASPA